jgi:hypothetical protein
VSDLPTLVRKVRRAFNDMPDFAHTTGTVDGTTNPVVVTLVAGQGVKAGPGTRIEWDDGTGETGSISTQDADTWTVYRSDFGEGLSTHASGARILISPRFEYNRITDVITSIINGLWPDIWVPLETTIPYQGSAEYFSPSVADIEDISYVYQVYAGSVYRYMNVGYVPPILADNTNFASGFVTIPFGTLVDTSTIYVAYKAVPTVANLLARQEDLVVDGTIAQLAMTEEVNFTGPSAQAVDRALAGSDKLRAGSVLWGQYQDRLQQERIRLLADEAEGTLIRG